MFTLCQNRQKCRVQHSCRAFCRCGAPANWSGAMCTSSCRCPYRICVSGFLAGSGIIWTPMSGLRFPEILPIRYIETRALGCHYTERLVVTICCPHRLKRFTTNCEPDFFTQLSKEGYAFRAYVCRSISLAFSISLVLNDGEQMGTIRKITDISLKAFPCLATLFFNFNGFLTAIFPALFGCFWDPLLNWGTRNVRKTSTVLDVKENLKSFMCQRQNWESISVIKSLIRTRYFHFLLDDLPTLW